MGTSRHWWNAQFPVVWASYGSYGHSSLILGPILHHRSSQSPASHGAQTLWPCPHWTPGSLEAHLSTNVSTVINMLVILIIYQTNKCSISEYGFFLKGWWSSGFRIIPFWGVPKYVSCFAYVFSIGHWVKKMDHQNAHRFGPLLKFNLEALSPGTFLPSLIPAKTEELIVHSRSLEDNDRAGTCIILLCGYPLVN